MIPQSFKDIVAGGEYSGLFQTLAMILFILVFMALVWYVISRPKKYYQEEQNIPLEDEKQEENTNIGLTKL